MQEQPQPQENRQRQSCDAISLAIEASVTLAPCASTAAPVNSTTPDVTEEPVTIAPPTLLSSPWSGGAAIPGDHKGSRGDSHTRAPDGNIRHSSGNTSRSGEALLTPEAHALPPNISASRTRTCGCRTTSCSCAGSAASWTLPTGTRRAARDLWWHCGHQLHEVAPQASEAAGIRGAPVGPAGREPGAHGAVLPLLDQEERGCGRRHRLPQIEGPPGPLEQAVGGRRGLKQQVERRSGGGPGRYPHFLALLLPPQAAQGPLEDKAVTPHTSLDDPLEPSHH
ncbi:unnamed protein product [Rangifer tarandus platyrhynchus]|uniref:Uncharacterized protein n=1 Tax=Rangifer tarandus platyrhynchus TaxID=3082113 RepID=A0AC59ZDF8_RANTA